MDPYRGEPGAAALASIPVDAMFRPLLGWAASVIAATCMAIGVLVLLGAADDPPPASAPRAKPHFSAAAMIALTGDEIESLAGRDVELTGVVRDLRSDSFGHRYIELGASTDWAPTVVQCYLADPDAAAPDVGAGARFRARLLGRSLGVAVQLDRCALEPLARR